MEKKKQEKSLHPLMAVYKNMWGSNGDFLSLQYAGHISDFEGENIPERENAKGRFESVNNIFGANIFEENYKNHCLKLLLQEDIRGNNITLLYLLLLI